MEYCCVVRLRCPGTTDPVIYVVGEERTPAGFVRQILQNLVTLSQVVLAIRRPLIGLVCESAIHWVLVLMV